MSYPSREGTSSLLATYLLAESDIPTASPEDAERLREVMENLLADMTADDVAWLAARDQAAAEAT
jgi:hypothetical protein